MKPWTQQIQYHSFGTSWLLGFVFRIGVRVRVRVKVSVNTMARDRVKGMAKDIGRVMDIFYEFNCQIRKTPKKRE